MLTKLAWVFIAVVATALIALACLMCPAIKGVVIAALIILLAVVIGCWKTDKSNKAYTRFK